MKPARRLEAQLDRLVDGITHRAFPGALSMDELLVRLVQAAESGGRRFETGTTVPNHFTIRINLDNGVARELATAFDLHAADLGWRLEGPVEVDMKIDPDLRDGRVAIESKVVKGQLPQWGTLAATRGGSIPLTYNRTLVGRSSSADIRLDDPDVSRAHALLWRSHGYHWVEDLASTNGTFLNNVRIAAPAEVAQGDRLTFGPLSYTFAVA